MPCQSCDPGWATDQERLIDLAGSQNGGTAIAALGWLQDQPIRKEHLDPPIGIGGMHVVATWRPCSRGPGAADAVNGDDRRQVQRRGVWR